MREPSHRLHQRLQGTLLGIRQSKHCIFYWLIVCFTDFLRWVSQCSSQSKGRSQCRTRGRLLYHLLAQLLRASYLFSIHSISSSRSYARCHGSVRMREDEEGNVPRDSRMSHMDCKIEEARAIKANSRCLQRSFEGVSSHRSPSADRNKSNPQALSHAHLCAQQCGCQIKVLVLLDEAQES